MFFHQARFGDVLTDGFEQPGGAVNAAPFAAELHRVGPRGAKGRRRIPGLLHAHHVPAVANPDAVSAWITEFLGDPRDTVESAQGAEPNGVSLPRIRQARPAH